MPRKLPLLCLLTTLMGAGPVLVSPALAQVNPSLTAGIKACMAAAGDPVAIGAAFAAAGWTAAPNAEMGLVDFAAPGDDQTFAYIADTGAFCYVESLNTGSAAVAEILAATLKAEDWQTAEPGLDSDGCTLIDLGDSITATLTSGGNDPTCASETDGAVRFEYGTEE